MNGELHHQKQTATDRLLGTNLEETSDAECQALIRDLISEAEAEKNTFDAGEVIMEMPPPEEFHSRNGTTTKARASKKRTTEDFIPPPEGSLPLSNGDLPRIMTKMLSALNDKKKFFKRNGRIVNITEIDGDFQIKEVHPHFLRNEITKKCNLVKFNGYKKDWVSADCTLYLAQTACEQGEKIPFPSIVQIITAPTLRHDGSVLDQPGFDDATGLFFKPPTGVTIPKISLSPTRNEIGEALNVVWYAFERFPFLDDVARSVHLSAMLTASIRPTIPTAPGTAYSGTAFGTGKTLLAKCTAAIRTGSPPVVGAPPGSEEEIAKRLLAAAYCGKSNEIFDNCTSVLSSATMSAFITSPIYSDRILGRSEIVTAPNRTLILFTGNGMTFAGDLVRRVLTAMLDAKIEASQVFRREFDLDPLAWILENRMAVVAAILTILRGFIAAGKPRTVPGKLASFEAWDGLVRQAVAWLGAEGYGDWVDPAKVLDQQVENDPEAEKLSRLMAVWRDVFGTEATTVARLVNVSEGVGQSENREMADALDELAGERGKINRRRLGRWLEARQGRIQGGFRIVRDGRDRTNSTLWRLDSVANAGSEGLSGSV